MGAENLAPTGIRSPDRPARNESLYRLSYSDPENGITMYNNCKLNKIMPREGNVRVNHCILGEHDAIYVYAACEVLATA